MFTGIIQAKGSISRIVRKVEDLVLRIEASELGLEGVQLGDSIAVNGVCLTVVRLQADSFEADVSVESLKHTNLGHFAVGTEVNLEKALTLATHLGGHMVSGHVDGVGQITAIKLAGRSVKYEVAAPSELHKYIAEKGSVTIDGVSLTVTELSAQGFCLNIVPHTAQHTIIPNYQVGSSIHIEVDVIARYTERLLQFADQETEMKGSRLDKAFLAEHGFSGRGH